MSKVRIFNFAKPLFLLLSLLLLSLFSTATAGALATENVIDPESGQPCYDIGQTGTKHFVTGAATFDATGTTGVPNSGVVHFDPPLAPNQQYRACVVDPNDDGQGPFNVKGWAWDDNLGFVSFSCGDEDSNAATPRTNLGVPCGNFDHAVTMEGINNTAPLEMAELSGYAWNDVAGYISFNCNDTGSCSTANHRVWPEWQDSNCIGLVYGNWQPDPTCGANLDTDVYAWSDSVGFFNFENALFPWFELIGVAIDWDFEIRFGSTDALAASANKLEAPYANGSDEYTVVLRITDSITGSPLSPAQIANFDISVDLNWTDTVDKIQTDAVKDSNFNAIVEPITINTTSANYDASTGEFTTTFPSVAPTSNMNGLDAGGGFIGFLYENFIIPEDGNAPNYPVPTNELTFDNLDISIEFAPISLCIVGGAGTCGAISQPTSYDGQNIEFRPAMEVTQFDSSMNFDFLSLRNNVADTILVDWLDQCPLCTGKKYRGFLDLDAGTGPSEWKFVYDQADDGFDINDPSSNINLSSLSDLLVGVTCTNATGACGAFSQDAYAYTTVSYLLDGKNVQYYSNKLPRVKGTLVVNPVAEFRGNVYSSGVTNPQTGKEVRSLGDISTNLLRNQIWNNVSKIIAGVNYIPPSNDIKITGYNFSNGFTFTPAGSLETLQPDTAGRPRVYYTEGRDVYINGSLGNLDGEQTIIVVDGNVYINNNIYKSSGDPHELGII
ncbi:hypothetical protein GF340_01525, partial [Candidatus Peregrinibacteria bacterium]|nr:hypothetical protein [Candidatus Peregrinibacteria bacterium]